MEIQMTISVSAELAKKITEILTAENAVPEPQTVHIAPAQSTVEQHSVPDQNVQPIPCASTVPVQPALPVSVPIAPIAPVAPPCTYTIEQIQTACAPLMDAGKQQELINLLSQFGVQSLPRLPKEQYGAFATALRGMGAKI